MEISIYEKITIMAIKHCEICGSEFVDYGRGKYCRNPHYKNCVVCGKAFEYNCRAQKIPATCSRSCASKLARKNTDLKEKACEKCGKSFKPSSGSQRICLNCKSLLDK